MSKNKDRTYRIWYSQKGEVDWDLVDSLTINQYPWYKRGKKQDTYVKAALLGNSFHLKVYACDRYSSGKVLEHNGSVYQDSCFEFFVTPKNTKNSAYINFEINCIGTLYLAYNKGDFLKEATVDQLSQVKIVSSLRKGHVKTPNMYDHYWTLHIEIPLDLIEELFQEPIDMDRWYGNFYRCGGEIDPQYAVWNTIKADQPDFHKPDNFGCLELMEIK